jgi:integrase/recombinase XerD
MASLFRPTYLDKKTGKSRKVKKWYGQYTDAEGKQRRVPLSENKTAAQQMLNDLVRKAKLGKAGILDPFEEHRKRPLTEHLQDWKRVLESRNNTEDYITLKVGRVETLLELCKFRFISDISASRIEQTLADLRKKSDRFGIQTSNHYLGSIKQFTRWLVNDRRTSTNPIDHLQGGNVKLDRRHQRRELSEEELAWLFTTVSASEKCGQLEGRDRELLYLISAYTGLRASELASLRPESFGLNNPTPSVTVEAAYSKHRREDVLPLHSQLVDILRPWLLTKKPGQRLWPGNWAVNRGAGKMLQKDLQRARNAWIGEGKTDEEKQARSKTDFLCYRDHQDRVADFHSLRHTFVTRLVRSGAKPKEAQTLARHSTITLTIDRYAHTTLHDVSAAIHALPPIPAKGSQNELQTLRATGTDGETTCTKLVQVADTPGFRLITDDNPNHEKEGLVEERKTKEKLAFDSEKEQLISGGSGIRTHDSLSAMPVFKTGAFNRSAIPPRRYILLPLCPRAKRRFLDISNGYLVHANPLFSINSKTNI